jgi:tripartite-type tricarboxylate transporter receptor subunit TctC
VLQAGKRRALAVTANQRIISLPNVAAVAEVISTALGGSPADAARYIREERAEWSLLIRDSGIKSD